MGSESEARLVPFDEAVSSEDSEPKNRRRLWRQMRRARVRARYRRLGDGKLASRCTCTWLQRMCSRRTARYTLRLLLMALACTLGSLVTFFFMNPARLSRFDMAFGAFVHPDGVPLDIDSIHYPETFLRSVIPIPCHSHNDQQRHTPLHAALGTGCISIEADIWASSNPGSKDILVGHDVGATSTDRTLKRIYIDPLVRMLEIHNGPQFAQPGANGVFNLSPTTSLTFVLDFKSTTDELWDALEENLDPLASRDWLTYWNATAQERVERPITIVVSGIADFDTVLRGKLNMNTATSQTSKEPGDFVHVDRYIFFDAPLHDLIQPGDADSIETPSALKANRDVDPLLSYRYNPSNSFLASTSLFQAIGPISPSLLASSSDPDHFQRRILRQQIRAARDRGLVSRYWGLPRWPRGLRDEVWEMLEREGVGLLNVDDLRGMRKGGWGGGLGGRWWKNGEARTWGWGR